MRAIKKPKTLVIIILCLTALLQVGMICYIYSKENTPETKTNFDLYMEIQNMDYCELGVEPLNFLIPSEWKEQWVTESQLIEQIKQHYSDSNITDSYDYKDKIIYRRTDTTIQIIKKDDLYINYMFFDDSDYEISTDIDQTQAFLTNKEFDLDNISINKLLLYAEKNTQPDPFVSFSIQNNNLNSDGDNGYIVIKGSPDGKKFAILSVSMSDEFFDNHPGLDKKITESLAGCAIKSGM